MPGSLRPFKRVAAVVLVAGLVPTAVLGQTQRIPGPGSKPVAPPAPSTPSTPVTAQPTEHTKPAAKEEKPLLDVKAKRIDGTEENLQKYKGKVVVIVNVASKCGFTVQYEALEKLYEEYKDKGLVILGFPANDFNSQEPGTNKEIAEFCSSKQNVTFPIFEKISVKGDEKHERYKRLTGMAAPIGGDPKWNFTKFVVDKDGKAVARFDAAGEKDASGKADRSKLEPEFVAKVKELLGVKEEKKAPESAS